MSPSKRCRPAKPPIWRRLVLPGDLVLDELHDVLQVAMGWQDGHLHKFGVGADRRTRAYFVTRFDLSEGDDGLVEDGVRLDQVVSGKGDRLFYDYDFGDGWEHVLVVEDVLDDPPSAPVCLAGKMACPQAFRGRIQFNSLGRKTCSFVHLHHCLE